MGFYPYADLRLVELEEISVNQKVIKSLGAGIYNRHA